MCHVATIFLKDRKMVNSDWCINHCLPEVFKKWCKCHSHCATQGLLLYHDNASTHIVGPIRLPGRKQSESGHPSTLHTRPGLVWLVYISSYQEIVMGDTVPKTRRWSSLLWGCCFHNIPVNVVHHHHHQSLNREGRWGTTDDFATSFLHFSLFSTALWDLPNSRPVHSLMLSSHLFLCMPCLLAPFTAMQDCFSQTWWTGDMTISLQFASLYSRQKVFVWSNCLLDLGTDFLVGNMVFVWGM